MVFCYWPSNKQYLYQPVASRDGRNPTDDLFRATAVFHGYEKHLLGYELSDLLSLSYAEVNDRQMLWLASQPSSLRVVISFLKSTYSRKFQDNAQAPFQLKLGKDRFLKLGLQPLATPHFY
jgi:hypothetical protein